MDSQRLRDRINSSKKDNTSGLVKQQENQDGSDPVKSG